MHLDINNLNKFYMEKLLVLILFKYKWNLLKTEGQDTFYKFWFLNRKIKDNT